MSRTRRRRTTTRDRNRRVIALPDFGEDSRNSGIGRMLTGLGLAVARLEAQAEADYAEQSKDYDTEAGAHQEDGDA